MSDLKSAFSFHWPLFSENLSSPSGTAGAVCGRGIPANSIKGINSKYKSKGLFTGIYLTYKDRKKCDVVAPHCGDNGIVKMLLGITQTQILYSH